MQDVAHWTYDLATGKFLCGSSVIIPLPYNPATQGQQVFPIELQPDPIRERFDAGSLTFTRPATPEELLADATATKDAQCEGYISQKGMRAFFLWVLAGRLGKTPAQLTQQDIDTAKNQIRAIYRALNGD